ncbi:hypothetical protein [Dokdonella sp.]
MNRNRQDIETDDHGRRLLLGSVVLAAGAILPVATVAAAKKPAWP